MLHLFDLTECIVFQTSLSAVNEIKSISHPPKNSSVVNSDQKRTCKFRECKGSSLLQQDAIRIYKKYLAKDILGPNRIPEELKQSLEKAVMTEHIEIILKYLAQAQKVVYNILEEEYVFISKCKLQIINNKIIICYRYINDFLRSDFHCKHQIDVLTSGNVQMADILYNETAFFYFMEVIKIYSSSLS